MSYWTDTRAGPGHLTRFGWREALRAGPAGWQDVVTWRTLRVAAGVVLPLAARAACRHVEYGAFASLGALPAGLASFQGVTRTRVTAVAVASAGMAVSTFAGGTVAAAAAWLLVPVVMVWGYVTGLAVCLGPLASGETVREKFAHLIEAHGRYTAALLRALAHPGGSTAAELDSLQAAARRARLDAEASAARLASEPEQSPLPPGRAGPGRHRAAAGARRAVTARVRELCP